MKTNGLILGLGLALVLVLSACGRQGDGNASGLGSGYLRLCDVSIWVSNGVAQIGPQFQKVCGSGGISAPPNGAVWQSVDAPSCGFETNSAGNIVSGEVTIPSSGWSACH